MAWWVGALCVLVLVQVAIAQTDRYVFLIAIDGLRADYLLTPDTWNLKIPNLRELIRTGTLAQGAFSVTPAVTYPAHTSMISGVGPNRHGILYNGKFDPTNIGRGDYYFEYDVEADTLFRAAKRKGLTTSGVNWPSSCGKSLDYNVPDAFGRDEQELLYLYDGCCRGPIESVIKTPFDLSSVTDVNRVALAQAFILHDSKPQHLTAIHISALDSAQHSYGIFSLNALAELERQDAYVGQILEAIDRSGVRNQSTIFVVSDHGFVNVTRQTTPGVLLTERGLTQQPWKAYPYSGSGSLAIYVSDANDLTTKAAVVEIVGELLRGDYGIAKAWIGEEVKQLNGWRDAYVVLEAQVGTQLSGGITGQLTQQISLRGIHGHTPKTYPELLATFLAQGNGIQQGKRIPTVELVDVAPTIASILDLQFSNSFDGRVLDEIFQ